MQRPFSFALALSLAACTPALTPPSEADLASALVPRSGTTAPPEPAGACWAGDVTPATIETVTEQVLATPERRAPDGSLIAAATFRTETYQKIVSERRSVWFQTPCPDAYTVAFVATVQRALKARGLYLQPVTGEIDAPTRAAIRAWQRPRGLDSDTLALASARALGIVAIDFAAPPEPQKTP